MDRMRQNAKTRLRQRKRSLVKEFGDKCADCKQTFPDYVYDFHHIDSSSKDMNPSTAVALSEERMREELDKCVMLCSNCHRIRHHECNA